MPVAFRQRHFLPHSGAQRVPLAQSRSVLATQKEYERYLALAQADGRAGDRSAAENYYPTTSTSIISDDVLGPSSNIRGLAGGPVCGQPACCG
jgi:hypothetical protein